MWSQKGRTSWLEELAISQAVDVGRQKENRRPLRRRLFTNPAGWAYKGRLEGFRRPLEARPPCLSKGQHMMTETSYTTDVVIRQTPATACPPNYLQQLHAEHKARQARFVAGAFEKQAPTPKPTPQSQPRNLLAEALRRERDALAATLDRQRRDAAIICGTDANLMEAAHPWLVAEMRKRLTPIRIQEIIKIVREFYGVSHEDMTSARRMGNVVKHRQVGMYLSHELTSKTLPEIGHQFGKDHTTALWGIRKIAVMIGEKPSGWDKRKTVPPFDPVLVFEILSLKALIESTKGRRDGLT